MSIDAALTCLGPGRMPRWSCGSDAEYENARQREADLVAEIERSLAERLGGAVPLPEGLVQEDEYVIPEDAEPVLRIGNSEGLLWAQEAVRQQMLRKGEEAPPELVHILEHHPYSGLYIPVAFSAPIVVKYGREALSVGSVQGLRQALHTWRQQGKPLRPFEEKYRAHLDLMCEQALEYGLALELI